MTQTFKSFPIIFYVSRLLLLQLEVYGGKSVDNSYLLIVAKVSKNEFRTKGSSDKQKKFDNFKYLLITPWSQDQPFVIQSSCEFIPSVDDLNTGISLFLGCFEQICLNLIQ